MSPVGLDYPLLTFRQPLVCQRQHQYLDRPHGRNATCSGIVAFTNSEKTKDCTCLHFHYRLVRVCGVDPSASSTYQARGTP